MDFSISFPFYSALPIIISALPIIISITLLCLLRNLRNPHPRGVRLPPGPCPWPVIGNIHQLGKNPNDSLCQLAKIYGPIMTLQLGWRTTVVASSPAMAKQVLKTHDASTSARTVIEAAKLLSYSDHSLVWSDCVPRWRTLRKICATELFTAKRLEALHPLRRVQVSSMMRMIYKSSATSAPVDIGHAAFLTSLNLLGNVIFSKNMFEWDEEEKSKVFKETLTQMLRLAGTPNLADFFPFLRALDPQGIRRKLTKLLRVMFELFEEYIEERLHKGGRGEEKEKEKDFLDILLQSENENGGKFTKYELIRICFDMFSAGSETTSVTIEWAMAELIRNPKAMEKVKEELDKVVGRERIVQESDVDSLHYLHAVIKETFRLHPSTPLLINHRAQGSCEIDGYVIPKDAQVFVNVWAIGRDHDVWKEPEMFFPERFMGSNVEYKGQNFELLPFGSGRRICPGLPLAHKMVHVVIATLIQCYDWQIPNGQNPEALDLKEKFGITLQKEKHLVAIPKPRLQHHIYN